MGPLLQTTHRSGAQCSSLPHLPINDQDALAPAKAPASPQQSGGAKTKKKKAKKKGGSGSHRGEEEEDLDEIVRELEGEPPKAKVKSPPSERAAHSEKPAKGAEKGVGGADAKAASGGKKAKQEAPVSAPVAAESRHQQQAVCGVRVCPRVGTVWG